MREHDPGFLYGQVWCMACGRFATDEDDLLVSDCPGPKHPGAPVSAEPVPAASPFEVALRRALSRGPFDR